MSLYVSDTEVCRRLGVSSALGRKAIRTLEGRGFPPKDPLFAGKRYWPAVRAFLDKRAGLNVSGPSPQTDGQENWNARATEARTAEGRKRARPQMAPPGNRPMGRPVAAAPQGLPPKERQALGGSGTA